MPSVQDAARRAPLESARCVFCRRQPVDPAWRPFCGERCKIRDLAQWADESYRIPGDPPAEPDDVNAGESGKPSSF